MTKLSDALDAGVLRSTRVPATDLKAVLVPVPEAHRSPSAPPTFGPTDTPNHV